MKNRRIARISIVSVLLIGLLAFGIMESNQKEYYKTALTNDYQRLFYDSKAHIENVEVSLSKAILSDSKEQNVLHLSQAMQQANSAQEKLTQMPIPQGDIGKTTKFLTQTSDYSLFLIKDHLKGNEMTEEQKNSLKTLSNYSTYLASELETVHGKIMKGDIKLETIKQTGKRVAKKTDKAMLNTQLVNLEEEMTKYPELIYDGPFSDQARKIPSKGLGNKKVNKAEARKIAEEFVGEKIDKVSLFPTGNAQSKEATIPSFTFAMTHENKDKDETTYISISRTGGKVIWMNKARTVATTKMNHDQATKKAQKFLELKGLENMEANYSQTHNNIITINFAKKQGDVTIYPDLVKVKVALDNGEIIGYDALHYLKEHHARKIEKAKLTEEQARQKVKQ